MLEGETNLEIAIGRLTRMTEGGGHKTTLGDENQETAAQEWAGETTLTSADSRTDRHEQLFW